MTTKRDQLNYLNNDVLQCRSSAYRHAWDDFTPFPMPKFLVKPDLMLRCTRCKTEKYLWMDHSGNYSYTPKYVYAEGYTLKGAYKGDRLTAAELRIEVLKRKRDAVRANRKNGKRKKITRPLRSVS